MKRLTAFFLFLAMTSTAFAHGDEDHGQGGAASGQASVGAQPRIETFTESFELIGQLQTNELSLFLDRYETNEPVLNGKIEAELGALKTAAKFRAERGDYVIDDQGFLKALAMPGKHALVFTVAAADESDLLEGTLEIRANAGADNHSHFPWAWAGGAVAVLVLQALAVRFRRSTSTTRK